MRKTNHRDCAIALLASREEVEFVSNDLKARDEDVKKLTERVKELEKEKKTIMDGWYHDNETIKSLLDKANDRILLAVEAIQLTPDNWKNKKMIEFLQSLGEGWDE